MGPDPARAAAVAAGSDATVHPVAAARLRAMLAFTQTVDTWYGQMLGVPKAKLAIALRLGAKIMSFMPAGKVK